MCFAFRDRGLPTVGTERRKEVTHATATRNGCSSDREVAVMIVVTTPIGLIGHQVLDNLLDSDEPIRVIARDLSRLPAHTRQRLEVVQGSHAAPDVATR